MASRRATSPGVGVAELNRHFSDYLDRVSIRGERVIVRRRSRPVAALVPVQPGAAGAETTDRSSNVPSAPFQGRGLLAAAGAWAEHPGIDAFLDDVRKARRRTRERRMPPIE